MSRINDMIKNLCPEGVKWVKLGDVCEVYDGTHQTPKYTDEGIPFISVENIKNIYGSNKYISEEAYNAYKIKPQVGDVFLTRIGTIGCCAVFYKQEDLAYYVSLALLRPNSLLNSYFLKNVLESSIGRGELRKLTLVNAVPIKINKEDIGKLTIPLPPLPIQQSIVDVLDKFEAMRNNLNAELALRRKQYEHFREKLLTFGDDVERVKLGDVCEYSKERIDAKDLNEGNYVSVENLLQDKRGKEKSNCCPNSGSWTKYQKNDVLIGNIRPYLKKIWLAEYTGGTNGDVLAIHIKNDTAIIPKYLYYNLSSDTFFEYDNANAKGAKMPRGDKSAVLSYTLFIPALSIQHSIVSKLDKFEALISNIERELELRTKQYEYYREKLLTF